MSSFTKKAKAAKHKAKAKFVAVFQPEAALNSVVLTLQLVEKAAEEIPIPGFKSAIGGLLLVIEKLEKAKQNHEDIMEMKGCLKQLNGVLEPLHGVDGLDIPWALRERIDRLAEDFAKISKDIGIVIDRGSFCRVIDASEDAQTIVRCIRKINHAIDIFVVEGMIQIEMGVMELLSKVNVLVLDKLPRSKLCAWDSSGMEGISTCLKGTREGVLKDITDWLERPGGGVYWLTGVAGSGKTTIAQTLAQMLAQRDRLGASFFCSRDQSDRSDLRKILPTVAYQLSRFDASFRLDIIAVLTRNVDAGDLNLQGQLRELVVQPLDKHRHKEGFSSTVVIIDAFDECKDSNAAKKMLKMFSESIHNIPLKFFITSRPERHIRDAFQLDSWLKTPQKLILHEVDLSVVQADIKTYLEDNLLRIAKSCHPHILPTGWPSPVQVKTITQRSQGLFIFAATACKFIGDPHHNPHKRLELLLDPNTSVSAPLEGLNAIYQQILDAAIPTGFTAEQYSQLRSILGTIILVFDRLTVSDFASLLKMDIGDIRCILVGLHSVLLIPDEDGDVIRAFHPSWHDFLVSPVACRDAHFLINEARQHSALAALCFERIELEMTGDWHSDNDNIPGCLEYAAIHWLTHMSHGVLDENMVAIFQRFDSEHVHLWLSVLSCLRRAAIAVHALKGVVAWLKEHDEWPQDVEAILNNAEQLSLQYMTTSLSQAISETNFPSVFPQIIYAIGSLEEPCSPRMLDGLLNLSSGEVTRIISKISSLVVVPISDDDPIQPLHPSFLEYLMDSKLCGNSDIAIQPGAEQIQLCLTCFNRIERGLQADARDRISLACDDEAGHRFPDVPIDLQYACLHWVSHLSRSPPGEPTLATMVNVFFSEYIPYWLKILSFIGRIESALPLLHHARTWLSEKHSERNVMPSVDETNSQSLSMQTADSLVAEVEIFIYAFNDILVRHPFHVHGCIAFIPKNSILRQYWKCNTLYPNMRVVLGLDKEWGLLRIVRGHKGWVNSIVFSPDSTCIVSGSSDRTVRIWDATTGRELKKLEGHEDTVTSVAFSPDGMRIVSGSFDNTVRIWNATTGTELKKLEGHWLYVNSVAFSPDGMRIVSGSADDTVRIWDATTGTELKKLEGHERAVKSVAFSPDGMRIVSGSGDNTVRIWDATTGTELKKLEGHRAFVESVAFAPDSMRIVSGSGDSTLRIWDATTGTELKKLEGPKDWVNSVAFSPDGMRIVSGSGDKTVRIWDATTGAEVKELEGHKDWVNSVVFSPDGMRIVSGSDDETVRVWDAAVGPPLNTQTDTDVSGPPPIGFSDQDVEDSNGTLRPRYRLEDEWVVSEDDTKICWVPIQYRGKTQSFRGNNLYITARYGRDVVLDFSPIERPGSLV